MILARAYTEGTDVKAGQVLFRIDPAPLKADLHAKEATLARAEADATNAVLTANRYRELAGRKLLSTQDLDTALANERTTAAAVKEAQAIVEKAQLDLSYATVTAPIAGRVGRALVTEGALVGQGEATELTTIEQIDPIYVNFSLAVADLQSLQLVATPPARSKGGGHSTPVEVMLPDGSPYPHTGSLDYSDSAVDPGTGAVSLRAVVANPDRRLLPGMFVNLRLRAGQIDNAFRLPQAAVLRDASGAYVLVVDESGKVARRDVQTHSLRRSDWIVSGALTDGEQVIVAGLQKVNPGGEAKAVLKAAADTASAAGH